MEDKQLNAMHKVVEALNPLDDGDLRIVLGFIQMRYGRIQPPKEGGGSAAQDSDSVPTSQFSTFPDLYHSADPGTEAEKALVAGYWVQVCQGNDGFDSYTANSALKQMGYTLSNITRALDILQAQDPKLVMQVRKTGSSRQARKVYKLTHAGLKRVAEMLNRTKDR